MRFSKPQILAFFCLLLVVGCGSSKSEERVDAEIVADAEVELGAADAAVLMDGGSELDAESAQDATAKDAGADRDASSNAACTFNRDCPAEERCECDESTGCFCRLGPRGTGVSGVTPCETGNDCESSLCVEGPGNVYYCSGECTGPEDCGPALPICADIAFLGRVCIREPPG